MKIAYSVLAATGVALVLATPAQAQDADDLSGPYVGVIGGVTLLDDDAGGAVVFDRGSDGSYGETVTTSGGADAFSPGFCGGAALGNAPGAGCDESGSDYEFGARLGYDWQLGTNFVAGALIEGTLSDVTDSATAFSTTPASYSFTRNIDYTAALRARLGYAAGFGMIYATGGLAAAKMDNTFATTNTANSFMQLNPDDWAMGYQLGGGVEFGLSRSISLGVEYLYNDFKDDDYLVRVGQGTAGATNPFVLAGGVDMKPQSDHVKYHSLRAALNFRF